MLLTIDQTLVHPFLEIGCTATAVLQKYANEETPLCHSTLEQFRLLRSEVTNTTSESAKNVEPNTLLDSSRRFDSLRSRNTLHVMMV